jgi:hypothetical protein
MLQTFCYKPVTKREKNKKLLQLTNPPMPMLSLPGDTERQRIVWVNEWVMIEGGQGFKFPDP